MDQSSLKIDVVKCSRCGMDPELQGEIILLKQQNDRLQKSADAYKEALTIAVKILSRISEADEMPDYFKSTMKTIQGILK